MITPAPQPIEISVDRVVDAMAAELASATRRAVLAEVARDAALAELTALKAQAE